jgi:hypothetical protein
MWMQRIRAEEVSERRSMRWKTGKDAWRAISGMLLIRFACWLCGTTSLSRG